MQQAGFSGVLIYNTNNERSDATVRMSAHSLADDIQVFAGFLSRIHGTRLLSQLRVPNNLVYITLSPQNVNFFTKKQLVNSLVDMGVLFILVIMTGTSFLTIGLGMNFAHNLLIHGELLAIETIHEASLVILAVANKQPSAPKLKSITFPSKILVKQDLSNDWKGGGVKGQEACPICIEEYEVGDCVRELPCHHFFHDTW
jgi:RING-like zinc finger